MDEFAINENITFTLNEGSFGLWNLETGEQYEIFEQNFLDRIFELNKSIGMPYKSKPEDELLIESGILLLGENAKRYKKLSKQMELGVGTQSQKYFILEANTIFQATCRVQR